MSPMCEPTSAHVAPPQQQQPAGGDSSSEAGDAAEEVKERLRGTVIKVGPEPLLRIEGHGDIRFAYRSVKKKPGEQRALIVVGDQVECRLTKAQPPKAVSVRLLRVGLPSRVAAAEAEGLIQAVKLQQQAAARAKELKQQLAKQPSTPVTAPLPLPPPPPPPPPPAPVTPLTQTAGHDVAPGGGYFHMHAHHQQVGSHRGRGHYQSPSTPYRYGAPGRGACGFGGPSQQPVQPQPHPLPPPLPQGMRPSLFTHQPYPDEQLPVAEEYCVSTCSAHCTPLACSGHSTPQLSAPNSPPMPVGSQAFTQLPPRQGSASSQHGSAPSPQAGPLPHPQYQRGAERSPPAPPTPLAPQHVPLESQLLGQLSPAAIDQAVQQMCSQFAQRCAPAPKQQQQQQLDLSRFMDMMQQGEGELGKEYESPQCAPADSDIRYIPPDGGCSNCGRGRSSELAVRGPRRVKSLPPRTRAE